MAKTTQQRSELYVQLVFDGIDMFIPQTDVLSVEIMADIHLTRTEIGAIGWFGQHGHGENAPIFCLSQSLDLLQDVPRKREYFILLKPLEEDNLPLGITCDEVEDLNVRQEHLYMQELPTVMHLPERPISKLILYRDEIAPVCTGPDLTLHIIRLSQDFTQANEAA